MRATVTADDPIAPRLEELYVRHAPAALRLAYFLTGDPEAARDLVQDAFVRMAGRFRHLRQPDAFDAYLRRTIVNLHASGLRRLRAERSSLAREAALTVPVAHEDDDHGARDEMWHAILSLPPRQRAAIVLRYYEDLSESAVRRSPALLRRSAEPARREGDGDSPHPYREGSAMNDLERQVRDTLLRHEDDAPPFDISDARRAARRTRRRQARNVVVGAIGAAAVIVAFAGLGGLVRADRSPTVLDKPSPSLPTPAPDDAHVSGWPGRSREPFGRLLVGRDPLSRVPQPNPGPHTQRIPAGARAT